MEANSSAAFQHLIVNRAEIVSQGCCACGHDFGTNPTGTRALSAAVGRDNETYVFCASCGDSVMAHVQDAVLQRYVWDWTVPLRGKPLGGNGKQ